MVVPLFFLFLLSGLLFPSSSSSSSASDSLSLGSSLSVETANDVLTSPAGVFTAGFFPVGDNAFCFSIWYSETLCGNNCTVVWMANRDQPVNGKKSKLYLLKSGNLVLSDAGRLISWSTNAMSKSSAKLYLRDNGNLVLYGMEGLVLWQSFNFPTDTLLPEQSLFKDKQLVLSISRSNHSSGYFKLLILTMSFGFFMMVLRLQAFTGRNYISLEASFLNFLGNFSSSDKFTFLAADFGTNLQRRLKIDVDGNLRLYSREDGLFHGR